MSLTHHQLLQQGNDLVAGTRGPLPGAALPAGNGSLYQYTATLNQE